MAIGAVPASALAPSSAPCIPRPDAPATPGAAKFKLFDANARWKINGQVHPREDSDTRAKVAICQAPWALIVGCIDSRVPPELVFDQGLGDLAVARTAGQVLDSAVYGSILYAVEELHVKIVVVLGHQKCGAVRAAISLRDDPSYPLSPRIKTLVKEIVPVVPPAGTPGREDKAIDANIRHIRSQILLESQVASRVSAGTLDVIGVRYELDTWIATQVHP
ncbi:carbonic anhydrase [Streptomyces sp. NBC_01433]|uniref:carbonic anhydrase n=1 Tax=Streptomyces sp. NBC_01433 TaxID=2903864 RepID=UPI00225856E6|nr:carbonic anhydrase [Streptomyces sp. NBC_01433]MCX4679867.1 carbonic anhydrase [Streptomyces sp. NBC_01433]